MGRALVSLVVLALAAGAAQSAGVVRKVRDSGPDENRVVLVLVAEGYTASQEARFNTDAFQAIIGFFDAPPLDAYQGHFNVYTDFVVSNEAGADKPAACYGTDTLRDTAFDATYCSRGIRRLLTVDAADVFAEVNEAVPSWDVVAVIVNDGEYGGAGGPYLTFSTHAQAVELFLHEAGHTFAQLADEYEGDPGVGTVAPEPNVTTEPERGALKWEPWVDAGTPLPTPPEAPWTDDVTGAFEGARYFSFGIWRPWHSCRMRDLDRPFGPVCAEAHVQNIYRLVSPLDGQAPAGPSVAVDACAPTVLEVTPLQPSPPTVVVEWALDGAPLAETGPQLTLDPGDLPGPAHEVTARLRDATPFVRRPYLTPMTAETAWTLTRAAPPSDLDGDGLDDACDPDDDGDGIPDVDDCAPADPEPPLEPPAVPRLDVTRPDPPAVLLTWTDVATGHPVPGARHEVVSGRIDDLRADRGFARACRLGITDESEHAEDRTGPRSSFWYLVRAVDDCAIGTAGAGVARAALPPDPPGC